MGAVDAVEEVEAATAVEPQPVNKTPHRNNDNILTLIKITPFE